MTSIDYLERMALASLLHDIGKFAQRSVRDRPRPKHTEAGSDFVREFVPEALRKGLYPVLGHHDAIETMDGMTKIVALADRLSAGERKAYPQGEKHEAAQMRSIFSRVSLSGATPPPVYIPLAETQVADKSRFMPQNMQLDTKSLTNAYAALWEDFCKDAKQLRDEAQQHDDLSIYLESLYHLMARYTATIPAAFFFDEPDVSLFDHSRVTAALACCIASMEEKQIDALLKDADHKDAALWERTPVALLVGGDISGVQDFIYTITSEHAAKSLRGRSLYLQLLTEAVLRYALRRLELPVTNVLYNSGARFFLLAPPAAEETLKRIRVEVTRKLWAHHRADLYLALGWATLAAADFMFTDKNDDGSPRARITERWSAMHQALTAAKRARYRELGDDLYPTVFLATGH